MCDGGVANPSSRKNRVSSATAASRVSLVTTWISPGIALPRSEDHWARRRMAHRLDTMTVGIQHKGAVIVGVILRPNPGRAIVAPASGKRRQVKGVDRRAIGSAEADMRAGNGRPHLGFAGNRE